jgi:hypothetical protein
MNYLSILNISLSTDQTESFRGGRFNLDNLVPIYNMKVAMATLETQQKMYHALIQVHGYDPVFFLVAYQFANAYADALHQERVRGLGERYANLTTYIGWFSNLGGNSLKKDDRYGCITVRRALMKALGGKEKIWNRFMTINIDEDYYGPSGATKHVWVQIKLSNEVRFATTGWETGTPTLADGNVYRK